jgi:type II secretory ATPase GspE/PulE/Tfp pilus assembly ATPase PilB-like protein
LVRKLGELLIAERLITEEQLGEALGYQARNGGLLGTALVRMGLLSEDVLRGALVRKYGIPPIELGPGLVVERSVLRWLPGELAIAHRVFPLSVTRRTLTLAMVDPTNLSILDELQFLTGLRLEPRVALESEILEAIEAHYGLMPEEPPSEPLQGVAIREDTVAGKDAASRFLSVLLGRAFQSGATEVLVESSPPTLRVRMRVNGTLQVVRDVPQLTMDAVTTRLRTLAKLPSSESRRVQTARLRLRVPDGDGSAGSDRTFRFSILGALPGDRVRIEILEDAPTDRSLPELGAPADVLSHLESILDANHGLVVVTGLAGSGKTTTFYSFLRWLAERKRLILTLEAGIEAKVEGIHQLDAGWVEDPSSLLVMKPDVLGLKGLGGEVDARRRCEIALAAARGRLVLVESERVDAAAALAPLVRYDRYRTLRSLRFVTNQRLVRKLCVICREPYDPAAEKSARGRLWPAGLDEFHLFRPRGCDACRGTGYRGRTALFELAEVDEKRRDAHLQQLVSGEIDGLLRYRSSLRDSALRYLGDGWTGVQEVAHYL